MVTTTTVGFPDDDRPNDRPNHDGKDDAADRADHAGHRDHQHRPHRSTQRRTPGDRSDYYEQLQEQWPAERPSSKRQRRPKRAYRRQQDRHIHVRGERLDPPDAARLSRALLAAQRELAQAQAEADARNQADDRNPGPSTEPTVEPSRNEERDQ